MYAKFVSTFSTTNLKDFCKKEILKRSKSIFEFESGWIVQKFGERGKKGDYFSDTLIII